jgi:hypothetical protein
MHGSRGRRQRDLPHERKEVEGDCYALSLTNERELREKFVAKAEPSVTNRGRQQAKPQPLDKPSATLHARLSLTSESALREKFVAKAKPSVTNRGRQKIVPHTPTHVSPLIGENNERRSS